MLVFKIFNSCLTLIPDEWEATPSKFYVPLPLIVREERLEQITASSKSSPKSFPPSFKVFVVFSFTVIIRFPVVFLKRIAGRLEVLEGVIFTPFKIICTFSSLQLSTTIEPL